jgi:hypothetical protein
MYTSAKRLLNDSTQIIDKGIYSTNSKEFKEAINNQRQATIQLDLLRNNSEKGKSGELSEFLSLQIPSI